MIVGAQVWGNPHASSRFSSRFRLEIDDQKSSASCMQLVPGTLLLSWVFAGFDHVSCCVTGYSHRAHQIRQVRDFDQDVGVTAWLWDISSCHASLWTTWLLVEKMLVSELRESAKMYSVINQNC
jgi:hypothetical protein